MKKIGKKYVFVLNLQPYAQECVVVCNGQISDAVKELKKHKSKNALEVLEYLKDKKDICDDYKIGRGTAFLYTELPHGYIMMISHQDSWIDTVGLIAHETLHLTHYVLRRAGVLLTQESEEAFTYLHQKTLEEILEKIY